MTYQSEAKAEAKAEAAEAKEEAKEAKEQAKVEKAAEAQAEALAAEREQLRAAEPTAEEVKRREAQQALGVTVAQYQADFAAQDVRIREKYLGPTKLDLTREVDQDFAAFAKKVARGELLTLEQIKAGALAIADKYLAPLNRAAYVVQGASESDLDSLAVKIELILEEYAVAAYDFHHAHPNRTRP